MPKTYSENFQGPPCNKKWYDYFVNTTEHWNLECSVEFCTPKASTFSAGGRFTTTRMFPAAIATNLQCKTTTTYPSLSDYPPSYDLKIHQLLSCEMVDEIDPRGLECKIPSAKLSFKIEGVDKYTPLDQIEAILDELDGKMLRIWRGFESHTKPILGDDGRWALDYYADYEHDTVCMGNYLVTDRKFNYEKQTIDMECEHVFFHTFANADSYLPRAKDGNPNTTAILKQRYPYPYSATEATGDMPILIQNYKLGYTPWEIMGSTLTFNVDGIEVPIYGWSFDVSGEAQGVDTGLFVQGITTVEQGNQAYWALAVDQELQSKVGSPLPVFTRDFGNTTDSYNLTQLDNTWLSENAISTVNAYNLMNRLRYIPDRAFFKTPEETRSELSTSNYGAPGTWRLVSGSKPLDQQVFLDEEAAATWNQAAMGSNGVFYPAIPNTPYKVTPSLMLSQSAAKDNIEWEEVQWVKSYYMDLVSIQPNLEKRAYSFQNIPTFTSNTDLVWFAGFASPTPSNEQLGYEIASSQPLAPDEWYVSNRSVINGAFGVISDMFGYNEWAKSQMGMVNIPNRGDSIVAYKVLWNTNLDVTNDKSPYNVELRVGKPTIFARNENDELIDVGATDNTKGVESTHIYGEYRGITKRILHRVNAGDVGTKPLYEISWSMVDDPSLRVGSVVWVPLQNEYLKVYITRQERSFDGGARLTCKGWCYEETGTPVYNPSLSNFKVTEYVNNPDTDPKGEWLRFTWTVGGDYSPVDAIMYKFVYTLNGTNYTLGTVGIMFGDESEFLLNAPFVSEQTGITLDDLYDSGGTFTIKAYFPPDARPLEASAKATIDTSWNNEAFSQLHVGYIRASNEHQPLIVGEPLQG